MRPKNEQSFFDTLDDDEQEFDPREESTTRYVPDPEPPARYDVIPDETVPLCKKKYADRWEAYARFAEIAQKRRLILVSAPIECARYYSFKVIHGR